MKLLMENWRKYLEEDVEVEPIPINQLLYLMGETDGSAQHTARDFLRDNTVQVSPDEKTWREISPIYTHAPAVYGYIKINNAPPQRILARKAYKAIGGNFPEHSDEYKSRIRDASRTQRLSHMGALPGAWLEESWQRFLNEEQEYEIYCDMDGVLVDFELGAVEYITSDLKSGEAPEIEEELQRAYITAEDIKSNRAVRNYMYKELEHNAEFWENLPWMPHGQEVWAAIAPYNPNILTTPMGYGSEIGKQAWIDKNLSPPPQKVFMSREKYRWANKNSILIDDWTKNTIPWEQHDGIAILHQDSDLEKTLSRLQELGL